jgi:hypothetical protein
MKSRTPRPAILAVALAFAVLAAAISPSAVAADRVDLVQLHVRGDGEHALIEIPVPVLEFLAKQKATRQLDAGTVNGRRVTFSLEKLLKALDEARAKGGETPLITVEEEGRSRSFSLALAKAAATRPGRAPASVVLTAAETRRGGPTRITVPLATFDLLLGSVEVEPGEGNDPMPLFKDLLSFSREFGTGLLARVVSDDGEVTLALE